MDERLPLTSLPPVLMLAYVYPPDNYSGAARPHRFAKYLQRLGHSVTIVAAGAVDGVVRQENVIRVRGELEHVPRKNRVEQVFRILLFNYDEGATWIPRATRTAGQLLRMEPRTVLFSTSPPVTTHLAALWLKNRYGCRWIADFRDPLVGNPFRTVRRVKAVDAAIEKFVFDRADVLVANTEPVERMWRERRPEHKHKFRVIYNGFDPEDAPVASPIQPRPYRTLTHVGIIYGTRQPTLLLSSIERLNRRNEIAPGSLKIQLLGPANLDTGAEAVIQRLQAAGLVEFTPDTIPKEQSREVTSNSDYLLLLDVLGREGGLQIPAKLFEYISIGRPILALTLRESPVAQILQRSGTRHTCIYPDDKEHDIDTHVRTFLDTPSDVMPASAWFNDNFHAEAQARVLSKLISV